MQKNVALKRLIWTELAKSETDIHKIDKQIKYFLSNSYIE